MAVGLPHEEEELDVFLYSVPGETTQTSCCSAIQDSCWGEVELQTVSLSVSQSAISRST
jgi:hypothetical protein